MHVTVVSDEVLFPTNSGGRTVVINELAALRSACSYLTLVVFHRDDLESSARLKHESVVDQACFIRRPSVLRAAVRNPLTSYQVASRWNRAVRETLASLPCSDVVVGHHDWTMPAARFLADRSNSGVVLRSHNDEKTFLSDMRRHAHGFQRAYLGRETMLLGTRRLRRLAVLADEVWLLSRSDGKSYEGFPTVEMLPIFADHSSEVAEPKKPPTARQFCFTGSLDISHNVAGLLWFCENVLPLINTAVKDVSFIVAGRRAPAWLIAKFATMSSVKYVGELDSVQGLLTESRFSINPALSGSGINIKCGTSASLGVPVVTTAFGARGLDRLFVGDLRPTDDAGEFAENCISLLTSDLVWAREVDGLREGLSMFSTTNVAQQMLDRLEKLAVQHL